MRPLNREASHKPVSKMRWVVSTGEPNTEAGKGKVTSEGVSRSVQRNQHWARECTGFFPVEKESGVVRTLRGVTNCPNIPATGPSGEGLHNYGRASRRTDKPAFHLASKSIWLLTSLGTILHFPWKNKSRDL